ncbi:MAG: pimeloyl-ACP methyl ester esterase BioH [Gammaproteobacteria bacterium]|nr:pimeloyl-ACP methyl ester esterase BioH [Gammaproteobacteria bacterium]
MTIPALHCQRIGAGPDLVLLHGWGLHAGIWAPLVEALAPRFRLHLYDLPGHGRSAPVETFTLESVCEALAQDVPEQAYWLGWSLGGMVALEFAARYPRRVSYLALLASNPKFVIGADWPHALASEVLDGFAQDLSQDYVTTLQRFVSLVARGAPDSGVLRMLRRALATAPAPTQTALRGGLAILRDVDLRPRVRELHIPVLWLGGVRDTLVPITALRAVTTAYPRMQLREIESAGHAPFVSHPQACAQALTEFFV